MPSSNTNISARPRRALSPLSSFSADCSHFSPPPPSLLKMIRKYRRSASGQSRTELVEGGRIGRLQPCKAPGRHARYRTGPRVSFYFKVTGGKKVVSNGILAAVRTPGGPLQSTSRLVSQHLYKGSGSPPSSSASTAARVLCCCRRVFFCFCFSLLLFS